MTDEKQHHGIDQVGDIVAIGIAGSPAGTRAGAAIRQDGNSLSPDGKPVILDVVKIGGIRIYIVSGKIDPHRRRVIARPFTLPIPVQRKRNIQEAAVIGAECDTNVEKKNSAVNPGLFAWHATSFC
ncbi:MAG TPA: hypothetical protein VMO78_09280 [Rhizomicrobium sp.]|nr:hypothetical protein [Rhizomicrobium sp.]